MLALTKPKFGCPKHDLSSKSNEKNELFWTLYNLDIDKGSTSIALVWELKNHFMHVQRQKLFVKSPIIVAQHLNKLFFLLSSYITSNKIYYQSPMKRMSYFLLSYCLTICFDFSILLLLHHWHQGCLGPVDDILRKKWYPQLLKILSLKI